jgi:Na+/H+ antiporter NhaD/arsenite permease-like protein
MIYLVLAIFILTYLLLSFRKIRGREIPVWVSMVVGAILMLATLSISWQKAASSISLPVIEFLFGMIVLTTGFERSGLIEYIALSILRRAKKMDNLVLGIIFGSGFLSSLFVNDTIALFWTPIVLSIGARVGIKETKALLLPLAFGITIGSAFTPIGNPQNLLVALNSGISNPFSRFLEFLLVPSVVSLLALYYLSKSRFFFGRYYSEIDLEKSRNEAIAQDPSTVISDWGLAKLSAALMSLLLISFGVIEAVPSFQSAYVSLNSLAFFFGLLLLILSPQRWVILSHINWSILIFFAGMFVVMGAVWYSGIGPIILSAFPTPLKGNNVQSVPSIMLVSVVLSQILSNVPFVQLYSYQLANLGLGSAVIPWLALAAGSTLAGNLTIFGAVSNVIIIDSAEGRGKKAFSFLEFVKYGSVITLVSGLTFFAFLAFV